MAWGVVLLAEATIMPALFGPRADVPLGWWGLGIALLVMVGAVARFGRR